MPARSKSARLEEKVFFDQLAAVDERGTRLASAIVSKFECQFVPIVDWCIE
jgi:hypothetical protein